MFVGQVAVLAFSTVDTLVVARYAAADLAALAVGAAAYITVFIGLMGIVLAITPIVGQLVGARRLPTAGEQLHQAVWIALALALPGCALLLTPEPFVRLARAGPDVADKMRGYLAALAIALPASLLFTAYRGFNIGAARPKAVMALQLAGLAVKAPLTLAFVFGVPVLGLPALGVTGCGVATAVAMWLQAATALAVLRRDPYYTRFALWGRGLHAPHRPAIGAMLRLGLPMGLAILVETTGFTFMAFLISRLSTTAVAGHQIAANLVALLFMMPLGIANATSTLAAHAIGAGDARASERVGWHGIALGSVVALAMSGSVFLLRRPIVALYTSDPAVAAAALPLLAWVVGFHTADAAQTVAAFVLRAWRIAAVPLVIYASAVWGVGLGGGTLLATGALEGVPAGLRGAPGYWAAATAGLIIAAAALTGFLAWISRRRRADVLPA